MQLTFPNGEHANVALQGEVTVDYGAHGTKVFRQGELSFLLADDTARAVMTEPSLRPWSPLSRTAGERPATLMHQIAKGYGDDEIAALADYFSKQSR